MIGLLVFTAIAFAFISGFLFGLIVRHPVRKKEIAVMMKEAEQAVDRVFKVHKIKVISKKQAQPFEKDVLDELDRKNAA